MPGLVLPMGLLLTVVPANLLPCTSSFPRLRSRRVTAHCCLAFPRSLGGPLRLRLPQGLRLRLRKGLRLRERRSQVVRDGVALPCRTFAVLALDHANYEDDDNSFVMASEEDRYNATTQYIHEIHEHEHENFQLAFRHVQ